MKKLPAIILAIVASAIPTNSYAVTPECVKESVETLITHYPQLQLQDIYKYYFHDAFGPGHLIPSREKAEAYLRKELEEMGMELQQGIDDDTKTYYEPSGCGERFYHVNLTVVADSLVDFDTFFNAFYDSMKDIDAPAMPEWTDEWNMIEATVERMDLKLPDFDNDRKKIAETLADGQYTMHHSKRFEELYHPHYRLISKDIFSTRLLPLLNKVQPLSKPHL